MQRNGLLMPENDVQEQLADIWDVIKRRPGLILICVVVWLSLGAIYYFKAPRTFESKADILIVTKRYSISGQEDDETPVYEKTMETHAVMASSPMIVGRALEDFRLASLPTLVDEEEPIKAIIDDLTARVKEDNTTILELSYRSRNELDCQKVVSAIAASYEEFLSESNQNVGRETADLIRQANEQLSKTLDDQQKEFSSFQTDAPLLWKDGKGVNVHHERQAEIEEARRELMVQRRLLQAELDAVNDAVARGGVSREALYYKALVALQLHEHDTEWRDFQIQEKEQFAEREAVRQYAALLVGEFVRLWVDRSEAMDEFDEGHPKVQSYDKRIEQVRSLLSKMVVDKNSVTQAVLGLDAETITNDDTDYVAIYLQRLNDDIAIHDEQISRLDREFLAEQELANQMQKHLLREQHLRSKKENTEKLFHAVVDRLQEIDLMHEYGGDSMTIVAHPEVGEQVAPDPLLTLLGSMMLGLLTGCGLAWSVDRSEHTFRTTAEIREALGIPVVGRVPQMHADRLKVASDSKFQAIVCTVHQEGSPLAEVFRGIRTNLYFSTVGADHKIIQITSPLPGDGKSTVTANLAVSIAKSGKRVLVIDADFRRPAMSKMFGIRSTGKLGLGAMIAQDLKMQEAVVETEVPNLYFLPVCERPKHPSELLSTPEFKELLDRFREEFDFVLIDTPPLLAVTDPCVVATRVDGVLLVVRIRKGVQVAAKRAMEMLHDVNATVVGVVGNGWERKRGLLEGPSYEYGYGDADYHQAQNGQGGMLDGMVANGSRRPKQWTDTVAEGR